MIPAGFLLTTIAMDLTLFILTTWIYRRHHRLKKHNEFLSSGWVKAAQNYALYRDRLLDTKNELQLQLEKAEAAWGDAQTAIEYKDKQITELCHHYKKLKTIHDDLVFRHNQVVGQFNSLIKSAPDGEMPI
jgi:ABC-type uncharacterized transport system YnjBCD substrate-binding protein